MDLKYVNPYSFIETGYAEGMASIGAVLEPLHPNQTLAELVDAVYNFVTTKYSTDPPEALLAQTLKSNIYASINGYLNAQTGEYMLYNNAQMAFIFELLEGTVSYKNPEDLYQNIVDIEERIISSSNLTPIEQTPLLYATGIGKSAYTYWSSQINNPASIWIDFMTSFTPAIMKFPYWISASMEGALISLSIYKNNKSGEQFSELTALLNATTSLGTNIMFSLFGSLAVGAGKVVFNLQQKKSNKKKYFILNNNSNSSDAPLPLSKIIVRLVWGVWKGENSGGCDDSWALCGVDIFIEKVYNDNSSSVGSAEIIRGRLNLYLSDTNAPSRFREQLGSGIIPVSRDINLPLEICSNLGISNYIIKQGNYKFSYCCGVYHFVF